MPQDPTTTGERFERLVGIMARLRAPGGCPWDREQNFDTIKPYLLEETYEVFDAIDQRDWPGLAEELGDLMLQAVFFAQMASEEGKFRIDDSLDAISEKLIRRHPHVFGDGTAKTSDDVKRRWDEIKAGRKEGPGQASSKAAWIRYRASFRRWWKRSRSAPRPRRRLRLGESRPGARQAG
jgi:ATP diphosphatase